MTSGWYRFTGAAGTMMLNYCPPNIPYRDNYCGAGDKGWINGILPEQSDGIVNRYVMGNSDFYESSALKEL